ncbi:tRNA-guanine transglycosylase family protein [Didymella exigua CBS 183.55]|uniref:Queuine tRNA-ribosyltransferase accessory subunit 2 n=1 Tax=Didymella exigua CBS 183.55 TaxID=1150837 RepID=A0A6A5RL05_9PLEO|nr:tRNA-guanine transglycosylase family protein [Didymella exigua CBS 183.55]KAF1928329.1 tRNA-guanine transglycosylase family protein [Didymella exigua CBS 183.55]
MLEFAILKATGTLAPRLGHLSFPKRKSISTPGFIGITSRGVIPHISQDNFSKSLSLDGVYVALEDFIEKIPQKTPPVFQYEIPEPLRRFIALPQDALLVLGPRRNPPIPSPIHSTNKELGILTSVGFKALSSKYYAAAARKLQPDIVVGLADIPFGQETIGIKRKDRMSDRTEVWTRDIIAKKATLDNGEPSWGIFAPILPIERDLQSWYLEHLVDDMVDKISGVAIYDAYLLDDLSEELHHLPRLSFHAPASPHEILRQVGLGMDIFTVPFLIDATDAGIALNFAFPAPPKGTTTSSRQDLGLDMWSDIHATSVTPLSEGCECYACTKHHRAYIQHLLAAKEMLGWALIQIHNHAVLSSFFAGIRTSIEAGTFDADVAAFERYYESALPEKTGQGPRVRGYQFKPEEHAKPGKKNQRVFTKFDDEKIAELRLAAAHGQQPGVKPEISDAIDEALVGLIGLEEVDVDSTRLVASLKLEDDAQTRH